MSLDDFFYGFRISQNDKSFFSTAVQNLIQLGAEAIIAGGTVPQVFVSGTVGEGSKVPVVSIVSSHLFSGTFLIQMSYSEIALVRCLTDIVKSYDWRKVLAIYEDDVFGSVSSSALLLSNALHAVGSELEYRAIFPPADSISDPRNTEVDIVVGDVQILANRSENVSFTKPYLTSGLAMLVPVKVYRSGWVPTKAFSLSLWLCILAMVVYYIMLVWFHEVTGEQAVEGFQVRWLNQLGASLWIVCNGIFLNLDKRIRIYHTKIVVILWFLGAQLVLNSFTASLSSILVTQNFRPDMDTTLIGCEGYSFVPDYLTSVLKYPDKNIVRIYSGSENDYKMAFENGTITAAYLEVPYLRVFLAHHENYTVSHNETQMVGGFGFVLPKGSPLANAMSIAILKIGENGTLRQLEKKWFSVSLSNYVDADEEGNRSLGLPNYTYMFLISSCLAFLTILHRYFDAIYHMFSNEQTPEGPQVQEVWEIELVTINALVQQEINGNGNQPMEPQRTRCTASSSNIPTVNRVLLSFLSDRPQRARPIEERPLRGSPEHELEDQPRIFQSFHSLQPQRAQRN
ncbi:glutamate receptor 2.3-like protein [Carex littledalei]|uniref:Glutamate receptor 2.3-like protein n=1 Tax=Carex littledalei TaxID=544730 RepID=A0A833QXN4_9POAL|nr:glutamate receptor 2.3-like protein [Carex littledalei]